MSTLLSARCCPLSRISTKTQTGESNFTSKQTIAICAMMDTLLEIERTNSIFQNGNNRFHRRKPLTVKALLTLRALAAITEYEGTELQPFDFLDSFSSPEEIHDLKEHAQKICTHLRRKLPK